MNAVAERLLVALEIGRRLNEVQPQPSPPGRVESQH